MPLEPPPAPPARPLWSIKSKNNGESREEGGGTRVPTGTLCTLFPEIYHICCTLPIWEGCCRRCPPSALAPSWRPRNKGKFLFMYLFPYFPYIFSIMYDSFIKFWSFSEKWKIFESWQFFSTRPRNILPSSLPTSNPIWLPGVVQLEGCINIHLHLLC